MYKQPWPLTSINFFLFVNYTHQVDACQRSLALQKIMSVFNEKDVHLLANKGDNLTQQKLSLFIESFETKDVEILDLQSQSRTGVLCMPNIETLQSPIFKTALYSRSGRKTAKQLGS